MERQVKQQQTAVMEMDVQVAILSRENAGKLHKEGKNDAQVNSVACA